jgi:hypothetical protein
MSLAFLGSSQFLLFTTDTLVRETFRLLFPENPAVSQIAGRAGQKVVHNQLLGMGGLHAEQFQ